MSCRHRFLTCAAVVSSAVLATLPGCSRHPTRYRVVFAPEDQLVVAHGTFHLGGEASRPAQPYLDFAPSAMPKTGQQAELELPTPCGSTHLAFPLPPLTWTTRDGVAYADVDLVLSHALKIPPMTHVMFDPKLAGTVQLGTMRWTVPTRERVFVYDAGCARTLRVDGVDVPMPALGPATQVTDYEHDPNTPTAPAPPEPERANGLLITAGPDRCVQDEHVTYGQQAADDEDHAVTLRGSRAYATRLTDYEYFFAAPPQTLSSHSTHAAVDALAPCT